MSDSAASHMRKAHRALKSCRLILGSGDYGGACNRAYYAMFYAAHAALQAVGSIKPGVVYKSHSGLIGAFGKELVLPELLPAALGKSIGRALNMRLLADYDNEAIEEADAEATADDAKPFIAAIEAALPALAARGTTP